jgi:hypothetical protein
MRGTGDAPKIVLLELRVSFACADALRFGIEGFLVGHIGHSNCGKEALSYPVAPVLFAHGRIASEPAYDVYVDDDKKTYKLPTPWQMNFGQSATLRC